LAYLRGFSCYFPRGQWP